MRAFIALNLPPEERTALYTALEPLRAQPLPVRWIDAAALHLTVKFLGEVAAGEVEQIDGVIRAAAERHEAITLAAGGLGAFPSLRRASIVWIGVSPEPTLAALQKAVELGCSRLGYAREQRPFRPHITVGRARAGARPADLERHTGRVSYTSRINVETIDLMRSHTGGGGARYETVLRRPLGARAQP